MEILNRDYLKTMYQDTGEDEPPIRERDSVEVSVDGLGPEREAPWVGSVVGGSSNSALQINKDDGERPEPVLAKNCRRCFPTEAEASAYLVAAAINEFAPAIPQGNVVKVWIGVMGKNFSNIGCAFDMDLGEAGPIGAYSEEIRDYGNEETSTFVNLVVHGPRPIDTPGFAHGSPVHTTVDGRVVVKERSEIRDDVFRAAMAGGLL